MAETNEQATSLTELTVDLLSAFVSNNSVRADDLAGLISSTHTALAGLSTTQAEPEAQQSADPEHQPAVSARKSLASRDHIISMIDGKPYRTLKRHLARHGLTPAEYRQRYKLPATYPMVAPGYSEHRREVAKKVGLGRKPRSEAAEAPSAPTEEAPAPRARGGRRGPRKAATAES